MAIDPLVYGLVGTGGAGGVVNSQHRPTTLDLGAASAKSRNVMEPIRQHAESEIRDAVT